MSYLPNIEAIRRVCLLLKVERCYWWQCAPIITFDYVSYPPAARLRVYLCPGA
jgi:hypothetical protein